MRHHPQAVNAAPLTSSDASNSHSVTRHASARRLSPRSPPLCRFEDVFSQQRYTCNPDQRHYEFPVSAGHDRAPTEILNQWRCIERMFESCWRDASSPDPRSDSNPPISGHAPTRSHDHPHSRTGPAASCRDRGTQRRSHQSARWPPRSSGEQMTVPHRRPRGPAVERGSRGSVC